MNDPILGIVSDRVNTRWGRRRPFLLFFAIPFGLAFMALWWAPPWESQLAKAAHVGLAYILTDTLQTLISVPFYALTPELARDYDDRTSLTAWRMFFNLGASLAVALAAPGIIDAAVAGGLTAQQGYLMVGAIFGFLGIIPPLLIAAVVRERPGAAGDTPPPVLEVLRGAWANRPFRSLTVLHLLNWMTFDLVGLMIPYFVTWRLAGGDRLARLHVLGMEVPLESAMLGALLLVSIPALPLWTAVANRFGKRTAYIVAMASWAFVQCGIFLIRPGDYGLAVGICALAGVGVAAAHVIPDAMLPDVVDEDELLTGRRNEGVYYGARNLFRKAAGALAVFVALQTLGWSGYSSGAAQPESAMFAIRLLVGPVATLLLAGAVVAAWHYPMTRERHAAVRAALDARGSPQRS